jgi:hypothetical protein
LLQLPAQVAIDLLENPNDDRQSFRVGVPPARHLAGNQTGLLHGPIDRLAPPVQQHHGKTQVNYL